MIELWLSSHCSVKQIKHVFVIRKRFLQYSRFTLAQLRNIQSIFFILLKRYFNRRTIESRVCVACITQKQQILIFFLSERTAVFLSVFSTNVKADSPVLEFSSNAFDDILRWHNWYYFEVWRWQGRRNSIADCKQWQNTENCETHSRLLSYAKSVDSPFKEMWP